MTAANLTEDKIKQFVLNITINFKRGKDELEFAQKEAERLHALLKETALNEWAKKRLEKLQELVLGGPDAEMLKTELEARLSNKED